MAPPRLERGGSAANQRGYKRVWSADACRMLRGLSIFCRLEYLLQEGQLFVDITRIRVGQSMQCVEK